MDQLNLSPPLLFVSDAHLGGFSKDENTRIESELVQLISFCQREKIQLAVLGDLFDYWMEFPEQVPQLGKKLLDRFEEYNQHLGPTLYITGNHDNWTRGHLADRGFIVEPEFKTASLGDKKAFLLHGDGLSDPDLKLSRPLLHRIIRHPSFVNGYQSLFSPATGLSIMKYFSRFNRWLDDQQEDPALLNEWAEQQLRESKCDYIIFGHDHIPRQEHFSFGSYINLGTFYEHRTMAFYNNASVSLVFWEPETQSLQPIDSAKTIDE
ncbi:UDP-2,3-diacylglucosamine diphosphatase [Fodinibius salsisoli]|uniref:Metallophosphoesterase family protein n=1 Tax=Fodinibius salsisoli TaxID=2820877 RepID=A0ABT3PLD6_9BACT|nr:metallophosphoesterase [Fodinibius salsisoli]MCW9706727.1 metallophosphoesterase family protein [Fodinibius salsisoli]